LRLVGEARLRSGRPEDAIAVLIRASEVAPGRADLLADLGEAYAAAGDRQAAEAKLRAALERDDAAVAARTLLGRLLIDAGRLEEAEAELTAALDTLPSYGDAAFALVRLERRRNRHDRAVNVLADFLMADPYHRDGLVRLGAVLAEADRVAEAKEAFRRVLRIHPGDADAETALEHLALAEDGARPVGA
ncbi:MAG: tetratricopeptide repeat protein, partial [Gemmatimonadota bacterium]